MRLRQGSLFGFVTLLTSLSAIAETTITSLSAVDDWAQVRNGERVVIPVLANDIGETGATLTIQKVSKPRFGVAVIKPDPSRKTHEAVIEYLPGPQFSGHDTFRYTVTDDAGGKSTATVTILGPLFALTGSIGANIVDLDGGLVGYLQINPGRGGAFSAKIRIGTEEYSLLGNLNRKDRFHGFARSDDGGRLAVSLAIKEDGGRKVLTGSFGRAGEWTVVQEIGVLTAADRAALAGRYTVELPSPAGTPDGSDSDEEDGKENDQSNGDIPQGAGWMMVKVNEFGEATLKGRTGDGRSFSVNAQVMSENGEPVLPFYEAWGGSVLGGTLKMGDSIGGNLTWFREKTNEERYPDGFNVTVDARGGRYTEPGRGRRALDNDISDGGRATLTISGGGVDEFTRELRFTEDDGVTTLDVDGDSIDLEIDRESGTFKGKFRDPDNRETRIKFSGVLLQSEGRAVGLFEADTKTGHIEFTIKTSDDDDDSDSDSEIPEIPADDFGNGDVGDGGVIGDDFLF